MIFVEKKLLHEMRDEEPVSWMGIMWNSVKKQFSESRNSTSTRKSWASPQTSVTCSLSRREESSKHKLSDCLLACVSALHWLAWE